MGHLRGADRHPLPAREHHGLRKDPALANIEQAAEAHEEGHAEAAAEQAVTPLEPFFDLVFAITQVTQFIADYARGRLRAAMRG
ncbi:hypothetical protein BH20ACT20_BH20ACT20_08200 [soil metagenome]